MNFIETIVEKDNKVLLALEECKKNGYPTYILGNGEGADNVEKRTPFFHFDGRLVSRAYYVEAPNIFCLEDVLDQCEDKVNIIVAFRGFKSDSIKAYKEKISILIDLDFFAGNCSVDASIMTYDWVQNHSDKLNDVYNNLADDYSRKVLSAYVNQKISSDYKYLRNLKTKPQYFEDLMPLTENEVFLDCGAYNGDSALAFIEALQKRGLSGYKKIYSFEPDPANYEKLVGRGLKNHICINKGTSDKKGELGFSMLGTSSVFDDHGEIKVPIERIDSEILDKVTLIKMDIEGAELASLKGGEKLILECKPKLAICIYHKKEDLWEILDYLRRLVPEYKFYIRAYEDYAIELVLYAIP